MKPLAETGRVLSVTHISDNVFDMLVSAPQISSISRPGQFVHVRIDDNFDPFLRRPLSVGPCVGETLRLIFIVKGEGTRLLSEKAIGDPVDMVGPLGSDFPYPVNGQTSVFVGGGIGVVPLLLFDDRTNDTYKKHFLLGVRSRAYLPVSEKEIAQREISVSSDDGSIGFHGNIVSFLEKKIADGEVENPVVYACGPGAMMCALKDFCIKHDIKAYASLEVPMGCGVGACQSCAVPRTNGGGYYLVCKDGPVFDMRDVELRPELLP